MQWIVILNDVGQSTKHRSDDHEHGALMSQTTTSKRHFTTDLCLHILTALQRLPAIPTVWRPHIQPHLPHHGRLVQAVGVSKRARRRRKRVARRNQRRQVLTVNPLRSAPSCLLRLVVSSRPRVMAPSDSGSSLHPARPPTTTLLPSRLPRLSTR